MGLLSVVEAASLISVCFTSSLCDTGDATCRPGHMTLTLVQVQWRNRLVCCACCIWHLKLSWYLSHNFNKIYSKHHVIHYALWWLEVSVLLPRRDIYKLIHIQKAHQSFFKAWISSVWEGWPFTVKLCGLCNTVWAVAENVSPEAYLFVPKWGCKCLCVYR